jgi:hypothetical protein
LDLLRSAKTRCLRSDALSQSLGESPLRASALTPLMMAAAQAEGFDTDEEVFMRVS